MVMTRKYINLDKSTQFKLSNKNFEQLIAQCTVVVILRHLPTEPWEGGLILQVVLK